MDVRLEVARNGHALPVDAGRAVTGSPRCNGRLSAVSASESLCPAHGHGIWEPDPAPPHSPHPWKPHESQLLPSRVLAGVWSAGGKAEPLRVAVLGSAGLGTVGTPARARHRAWTASEPEFPGGSFTQAALPPGVPVPPFCAGRRTRQAPPAAAHGPWHGEPPVLRCHVSHGLTGARFR